MTSPIAIEIAEGPLRGKHPVIQLGQGLLLNHDAIAVQQSAVVSVGRAPDCQICLPPDDDQVSRHHFLLEIAPGGVRVRDCGSRNGTFVNGVELARDGKTEPTSPSRPAEPAGMELQDGDRILAGQTVFRVSLGDRGSHGAPSNASASPARPRRYRWPGVGFLLRGARRKQDEVGSAQSVPAPLPSPFAAPRCPKCGTPLAPGSQIRPLAHGVCDACWREAARHPTQLLWLLLRATGLTERHAALP